MLNWILARAREKSTWTGLFTAISGIGLVSIPASTQEQVIAAGVALAGLAQVFFKENGSR